MNPAYPEQEFVPATSSARWSHLSAQSRAAWSQVAALPCVICGAPVGNCVWILSWASDRVAHLACQTDTISAELSKLNNPFLVEAAAKQQGLTIAGFQDLPSWERARYIRDLAAPADDTGEHCAPMP